MIVTISLYIELVGQLIFFKTEVTATRDYVLHFAAYGYSYTSNPKVSRAFLVGGILLYYYALLNSILMHDILK